MILLLDITSNPNTNDEVLKETYIAIKLCINQTLFDKGYITEEMYIVAKDKILLS